jgi:hypothetical protein
MRTPRKIKPNAVFGSNDTVYDLEEIREWTTGKASNGETNIRYYFETTCK